jgi:hypothetical protein
MILVVFTQNGQSLLPFLEFREGRNSLPYPHARKSHVVNVFEANFGRVTLQHTWETRSVELT